MTINPLGHESFNSIHARTNSCAVYEILKLSEAEDRELFLDLLQLTLPYEKRHRSLSQADRLSALSDIVVDLKTH